MPHPVWCAEWHQGLFFLRLLVAKTPFRHNTKKTPPTGGVFFLSEALLRGLDGELHINVVARTGPLINGLLDLRRIGVLDLDGGGDGVDLTRLDLVLVLRLAVGQLDHGWQPFMCELVCTTVILRASGAWGQKLHDNLT